MGIDPFDLASLFELRSLLDSADPNGPPSIGTLRPQRDCSQVALLPGSFNPPTAAHVLLAERALQEGFDLVVLLLARNTVGKEPSGLIPEDRLLAMHAAASSTAIVAVSSHGLYAEQAEAARALYPTAEITLLVGSDKVLQIFDDRWYEDRADAMERLFTNARLVVAPRSDQSEDLRTALQAAQNRPWADRVSILRLHPAVSDLSSTRVRGLLRAGAEPAGLVPPAVAELLGEMRAFAPPIVIGCEEVDAYEIRTKLLDLLWRSRGLDATNLELRALMRIALSGTEAGGRLRAMLAEGDAHPEDLVHVQP